MEIDIVTAQYLYAAITTMCIDPLVPQPTTCPTCGKGDLDLGDRDHVTAALPAGVVVLLTCDGRMAVNPELAGVFVTDWEQPGPVESAESAESAKPCGGCNATPGNQRGPWHGEQCGRWAPWPAGNDPD